MFTQLRSITLYTYVADIWPIKRCVQAWIVLDKNFFRGQNIVVVTKLKIKNKINKKDWHDQMLETNWLMALAIRQ